MERGRQNDDEHHKMWELSHWTWSCNPTCGSVFIVLFPAQYLDIYTISRYLHNISAAALLGIEIQEVRFPGFPAPRLAAVRWEWVVGMRWWITISSIYYIYLVSALIISIPSVHDTVLELCHFSASFRGKWAVENCSEWAIKPIICSATFCTFQSH